MAVIDTAIDAIECYCLTSVICGYEPLTARVSFFTTSL